MVRPSMNRPFGSAPATAMPWRCNAASGPMPDSIKSCGEFTAPPDRITSLAAVSRWRWPSRTIVMPVARAPVRSMRSTKVSANTCRFWRAMTGCRNAREFDRRMPSRWFSS